MTKLRLYKIIRYYDAPAEVLVIAGSKKKAKELSNKKYGANEGQKAIRVNFKKERVLHLN